MRIDAIVWLLALAAPAPEKQEASPAASKRAVMAGEWGGARAQMEITPDGARIELPCARGVITGPLEVDKSGRVDSSGSLIREGSGAGAETDAGSGEIARFRGKLSGKTLTLTVTLEGSAQDLGTFKLTHGRPARLSSCP